MSRLQAGRITHRQDAQEMQDLREKVCDARRADASWLKSPLSGMIYGCAWFASSPS